MAHDAWIGGLLVNAQQDALVKTLWLLRAGWGCGQVVLVMSIGLHIGEGVNCFSRHLKMPPVAALANIHAVLGRSAASDMSFEQEATELTEESGAVSLLSQFAPVGVSGDRHADWGATGPEIF